MRDKLGAHTCAPGKLPVAEPEYPNDGATDPTGWTGVSGVYGAPAKAAQAIVELQLRWASRAPGSNGAVVPCWTPHPVPLKLAGNYVARP